MHEEFETAAAKKKTTKKSPNLKPQPVVEQDFRTGSNSSRTGGKSLGPTGASGEDALVPGQGAVVVSLLSMPHHFFAPICSAWDPMNGSDKAMRSQCLCSSVSSKKLWVLSTAQD